MMLEYYVTKFDAELRDEITERVKIMHNIHKKAVIVYFYCGTDAVAKSIVRYYRSKGLMATKNGFRTSVLFRI